jgi:hypothetical protein
MIYISLTEMPSTSRSATNKKDCKLVVEFNDTDVRKNYYDSKWECKGHFDCSNYGDHDRRHGIECCAWNDYFYWIQKFLDHIKNECQAEKEVIIDRNKQKNQTMTDCENFEYESNDCKSLFASLNVITTTTPITTSTKSNSGKKIPSFAICLLFFLFFSLI